MTAPRTSLEAAQAADAHARVGIDWLTQRHGKRRAHAFQLADVALCGGAPRPRLGQLATPYQVLAGCVSCLRLADQAAGR